MAKEKYHVEYKYEGKWWPAYGTHLSKEAAKKARKNAMFDIEADTGKKENTKDWRVALGPGKRPPVALDQWLGVVAFVGIGLYFLTRED